MKVSLCLIPHWNILSSSHSDSLKWKRGLPIPCRERSTPWYLWKYTSHPNYRNCKVDISTRQGHSGSMCANPLLFHYIIRTCDVKRRSHADNIIVSLYGRGKTMTLCSPWESWENWKNLVDVHTCIHLWQVTVLASNYCVSTTQRK